MDKLIDLWEVYERDGTGCAMYLYKEDAKNCDCFPNGYDKIVLSKVYVSIGDMALLESRLPIFA